MYQEDVYVNLEFYSVTLLYSHSNSSKVIPPLPTYTTLCLFLTLQEQFAKPKHVCLCDLPLKWVHLNRRYLIEEMVFLSQELTLGFCLVWSCTAFLCAVSTRLSLHVQIPGCFQKISLCTYIPHLALCSLDPSPMTPEFLRGTMKCT